MIHRDSGGLGLGLGILGGTSTRLSLSGGLFGSSNIFSPQSGSASTLGTSTSGLSQALETLGKGSMFVGVYY